MKKLEKRTFKNGCFYNENGFVVAISPYSLPTVKYKEISNNHGSERFTKDLKR